MIWTAISISITTRGERLLDKRNDGRPISGCGHGVAGLFKQQAIQQTRVVVRLKDQDRSLSLTPTK
jgi:hypothetical protein